MRLTPLVVFALALPLAGQDRTYALTGESVAIYNIAGQVTVEGGGSGAVAVAVDRIGDDAGQLKVETGELRGRNTLRVIYPGDRIIYSALGRGSNSTFSVREDGTWGDDQGDWNRSHDGRRITVRGDGSGLEAAANLRITVPEGRAVAIYLGVGRIEAANVRGTIQLDARSADITARGTGGRLHIDTGSGDIAVSDANGEVSLDTGSGDVRVSDMTAGDLEVDTGSGNVTGTAISARLIKIDTGSGDVRLDGATTPNASVETGSGEVRLALTGLLERLQVETGSGNVTIRLPEAVDATVNLETGSGELDLAVPLTLIRKSQGEIRGRLGEGRGRIEIETGSGDIALLR